LQSEAFLGEALRGRRERVVLATKFGGAPAVASAVALRRVGRLSKEASSGSAEERGVTLLEVAIGGLAAQEPVASVIAGATRPEQVRANAAAGAWEPAASDLEELLAPAASR
jgi:aryl-alcohol dehydrogenase-like predicted oxidoreductase